MGRIPLYKIKDLIKHAYIIPTYAVIAAGAAWVATSCIHCAQNPEISWKRPYFEPFEAYRNKTYKFWMSEEYLQHQKCLAPEGPCYLTADEQEQQQKQEEQDRLEAEAQAEAQAEAEAAAVLITEVPPPITEEAPHIEQQEGEIEQQEAQVEQEIHQQKDD